ncbi:hypothetical protein SAMN05216275_1685 [Streptosporangium canum]|uniref:Transposase DDE domain-containing protein n=1 Tax=Streptosporangium canum TaxID=324952 RepID=A0A1I4FP33_9ACTN|nr:ISAs1 family transposase [Streptosporangium canum]SFL19323.1 hypothetical protein SAMN05216275_1685 [Streptosporangium canum]
MAVIWQWSARTSQQVLQRLGAYRDPFTGLFTVPSERTFRRVLAELDADARDTAISGYAADVVHHQVPVPQIPDTPGPAEREQRRAAARQLTHPAPPGLLPAAALDGKALRGTRTAEGGRVFLVGAISHEHGVILGQCQVAGKKGEGPAARTLLPHLPVEGMVLTLDALHTTKTTARLITQMGGHYVLIVKGNQPLTRAAAHALLSGRMPNGLPPPPSMTITGTAVASAAPSAPPPPMTVSSPAPGKPSGSAATSASRIGPRTAPGSAKRLCSASPACPPTWQVPSTSTTTSAGTGAWKIG